MIASGGTPYDPAAGGSDGTNCASPMTDLLGSPEAPIVLAERAELDPELALSITAAVAFGHRRLGGEQGIDVMRLSQDKFSKLDEETKAKLRGDEL